MSETKPRPEAKGWDKLASVIKAILTGHRSEDKNARIMAVLLALVGILGQALLRADSRTDRTLEAYRKDSEENRAIMLRAVVAQERVAAEMERTRTTLLEKIPDATPVPRPAVVQPLPARRRP